jgi:hypothetical protein
MTDDDDGGNECGETCCSLLATVTRLLFIGLLCVLCIAAFSGRWDIARSPKKIYTYVGRMRKHDFIFCACGTTGERRNLETTCLASLPELHITTHLGYLQMLKGASFQVLSSDRLTNGQNVSQSDWIEPVNVVDLWGMNNGRPD